MPQAVKTLTTLSLNKTKRPKVKQVVERYGLNLNRVHQLLEDYIYQTGELPLFLLNPKAGEPYDATSDFADYFTPILDHDYNDTAPETETLTQPLPIRAGAFLSQQLTDY